ncbi:MAG: hypothetical protein K1X89_11915 [Myxococcaceae bacterium]|nr:hypothetical protein [Myxococcaceae bacterium]
MGTFARALVAAWLASAPAPAPAARCASGQVKSAGHCCWPGQTWDDKLRACTGELRCPEPLEARLGRCLPRLAPELERLAPLLTLKPLDGAAKGCGASAYVQRLASSEGCTLSVERALLAGSGCTEPALLSGGPALSVALDRLQSLEVLCSWPKDETPVDACLVLLTSSGVDERRERGTAVLVADTPQRARALSQALASAARACGKSPTLREVKR